MLLDWNTRACLEGRFPDEIVERICADDDPCGFFRYEDRMDTGEDFADIYPDVVREQGQELADIFKFYIGHYADALPRTRDIINQVANMQSEIGIIYLSDFNKDVIGKLLREKHLEFHPLFRAPLHVFISRNNPLAAKKVITMEDLKPYPFIQYEQGEEGSFYFYEEAVWPEYSPKQINVTDRATILNFIIGLNGYTVCTGIDNGDLNNEKIVTVPLDTDETMLVGWITNERSKLSKAAETYLDKLKSVVSDHGYKLID